jgi:hypothetical protein
MEPFIVTIGLTALALVAGRFAKDTHADDTSPWWPGYGDAATLRARF